MGIYEAILSILGGAVTIGGFIGIALAYKRKTDLEVLRASNKDYKERNEQLESDIDRIKKENAVLEAQRILPFEKLTKLMVNQHSEQMESGRKQLDGITKLTRELGNVAKNLVRNNK